MKLKKIALYLLVAVVLAGFSNLAFASPFNKKQPSDYNIGMTYAEAIKDQKPVLALFYADWCGYCLKFMPKQSILNMMYKDKYNFVMVNVDDKENKPLIAENQISGYPTVYILDNKYDNKIHLSNGVYGDLKLFRAELDRYIRIRQLLDNAK